jgi:hypothetical protein
LWLHRQELQAAPETQLLDLAGALTGTDTDIATTIIENGKAKGARKQRGPSAFMPSIQ